ncbi:MAG: DUF4389 domain-containing protein [Acidimicrobiia bacterium]|nr:DUF4389 domain-containing protein [Acidimicrobiia bacterium]
MRATRIVALVVGSLLGVLASVLLVSGTVLAGSYAARSDDGFVDIGLDPLVSPTVAVTAEHIDLQTEPGTPSWVYDALDTDVRLRVTPVDGARPIFVGVAPEADLDNYLAGVAHDEIREVKDLTAAYRSRTGTDQIGPPTAEDFWAVSTSGDGTQELVWEATPGRWAVAVMNADGSPGVNADVNVGIRSAVLLPVALGLLVAGVFVIAGAVMLIVAGGRELGTGTEPSDRRAQVAGPAVGDEPETTPVSSPYPLSLEAQLDEPLSRWMWLVKLLLALPHLLFFVLLWIAYLLLSIVAGVSILFTGRYPRSIFDFNVGVLRWSWRVSYYAFSGGLGTDRYPPFSLGPEPDYPATLDVEYPERLSRTLVLFKWWLLAIPHYIVVAVIAGGGFGWQTDSGASINWGPAGGGLVGVLTLVAAAILLVTGAYPRNLFDLIVGLNRWVYRVVAYASLMTDRYPPFRLDQGGAEPGPLPGPPRPSSPDDTAVDTPVPTDRQSGSGSGENEVMPEPAGVGAELPS